MNASRRAELLEWAWWIITPVVAITYMLVSTEPMAERLMFAFISAMSSMALAITYGSKGEAAKAKEEAASSGS